MKRKADGTLRQSGRLTDNNWSKPQTAERKALEEWMVERDFDFTNEELVEKKRSLATGDVEA